MPEAMLAPGMDSESPIPVGMGDSASQKLELEETETNVIPLRVLWDVGKDA